MNGVASVLAIGGSLFSGFGGGGSSVQFALVGNGGSSPAVAIQGVNVSPQVLVGLEAISLASMISGGGTKKIKISRSGYPEAADHIKDAQQAGQPKKLTIDRNGAAQRRAESLKGYPTIPGFDRDEYPPAVFLEGGAGASVRYIQIGDNRGAGAILRWAISGLPNGTKVIIEVVP